MSSGPSAISSSAGIPTPNGGWCIATSDRGSVELRLEPAEVQPALGAAGDRRVADHEPDAADVRDEAVLALAVEREVRAQRVAVVVVARQHVDGHRQRREQLAHALVLRRRGRVGEVAADEHRVRARPQRQHGRDAGGQRLRRPAVAGPDEDVRVAELGEDHSASSDSTLTASTPSCAASPAASSSVEPGPGAPASP